MLLALISAFFTDPLPLEMPRADAFLLSDAEKYCLEDRYDRLDLWTSRTVEGRWQDDDGRVFTLSLLATKTPAVDVHSLETRTNFSAEQVPLKKKDLASVKAAVARLSEIELPEKGEPPRQPIRGYDDVDYWQGTNRSMIVCAFLPAKTEVWYLATWWLVEEDDFDACRDKFEDEFLAKEFRQYLESHPVTKTDFAKLSEREQLRYDARHSVSNYACWHVTDSEEFTVLDDLRGHPTFISTLTNDLALSRQRFARTMPTLVIATNSLAVARIFADRAEYLDAVDESASWTAAYWSPGRRELVAHLGDDGDEAKLLKTMRHESFHQYIDYATSMMSVSPWLNEGYAQYFEDESSRDWKVPISHERDNLEKIAATIPALMQLDYAGFYDGSNEERMFKYRLAWSIAVFLEDESGARKVRFDPFRDLKSRYFAELMRSRDQRSATNAMFENEDSLKLFLKEWVRFWRER